MQGWARLDAAQRHRFFEAAFLNVALRLDKLELRAWLRRRLKNPPLAPPFDPARLIGGVDIALVLRAAGEADPAGRPVMIPTRTKPTGGGPSSRGAGGERPVRPKSRRATQVAF